MQYDAAANDTLPSIFPEGWWHSIAPEDIADNIEYGSKLQILMSIIAQSERANDKL